MSSLERGYLPLGVGPQVRPVLSYHKWGQLVFRRANKFEILYGTPYEGDSFLQRIISNKEQWRSQEFAAGYAKFLAPPLAAAVLQKGHHPSCRPLRWRRLHLAAGGWWSAGVGLALGRSLPRWTPDVGRGPGRTRRDSQEQDVSLVASVD